MTTCPSMAGRPVDFSTQESDRRCIEGESYQLECAGTEGCVGTPFEVLQVHRIDSRAGSQCLDTHSEFDAASTYPAGQITPK